MQWKGTLTDSQILGVMSDSGRGLYRGCYWDDETWFAVLDIDANSKYHTAQELKNLRQRLASIGLPGNVLFQSSDSGGWHLYIPFTDRAPSKEVEQALKAWLKSQGYEIRGGQLEVFPSGNGLRLPLQPGFAWLAPDGSLIRRREEMVLEAALSSFLSDFKNNANDWSYAKPLIESQLAAADRVAAGSAQALQERLEMGGFDDLYSAGKMQEVWEKGRKWWQKGLASKGERHDAVLAVGHYLWYGDSENGVAALPGARNDEYRAKLIEHWLTQKHNGFCRHIDQNKWEEITAQIKRAVLWRGDGQAKEYEPYRVTDRLLKRLMALYRKTGKLWTVEEFEKANHDRRLEARARIAEAIINLEDQGRLITIAEVARQAGSHWSTVKKNVDLLAPSLGEYNRGGGGGLGALLPFPGFEFEEEKKEASGSECSNSDSDFEIESSSGAGCVLDSLRYDRTGQTATNSRQVTTEVLAAVHPIQSNSGVKHELSGSAPCVASGGFACGINGFLPTASQRVPSIYSSAFFSIGAPAQNLRQVGNQCDGCVYNADRVSISGFWLGVFSKIRKVDVAKAQCWLGFSAGGHTPLSCYDKRRQRAGGWLLSPNGYIALSSGDMVMANEAHEKPEEPQRSTERQPEHTKQAQSEANAGSQNYADQVKAYRQEQKLSGKSKATGAGADAFSKGGLASAKDLLGDLAHGHPILIADNDKPVLVAEKPEMTRKSEPTDGPPIKLETVLSDYKTPFTEAFERSKNLKNGEPGKLEMLEETMNRLQSVPWREKIDVIFNPRAKNPEYDPVNSRITINPKHGTARQIEEFVHEGFHATHQSIGALYINKPQPVSLEQYFNERAKGEVCSFIAEIKVNAELKNPKPVEFEHVVNGVSKIANLSEIFNKQGEKGLRDFLLDAKPVLYNDRGIAQVDVFQKLQTAETYREHYEKSYKTYVDTFQQVKPQAGAVLRDYQKQNPGKTTADFIEAGY
jgi:hypothetical protein